MADIANGALNMAAADKAAAVIGDLINGPVAAVIDQAASENLISNTKAIILKKRGEKIAAHVLEQVMGYHQDLIDAATEAGVDVGPPADGKQALIDAINGMVSPLGGGR